MDEPNSTETTPPVEGEGSATPVVETPPADTAPEPKDEGAEATKADGKTEPEGKEPKTEATERFFNGESVTVEVPDEVKGAFEGTGLDADALVSELYRKDGDFTLSDDTKAKLYEKFPQPLVDNYLGMLKQHNEGVLKGISDQQTAATASAEQAEKWAYEQVGGQEQWTAMSEWLTQDTESVSDAEIASFNRAMESGDQYIQGLAIKAMQAKFQAASGDGEGIQLIDGEGSAPTQGGALDAEGYRKAMLSPEHRALRGDAKLQAQRQLDARRRAGINKGI